MSSIDTMKKMVSLATAAQNAKLKQMELSEKTIKHNDWLANLPAERQKKAAEFKLGRIENDYAVIGHAQRALLESQSPEDVVALNRVIKTHQQSADSTLVNFEKPLVSIMSPTTDEDSKRSQDATLNYSLAALKANGATEDQLDAIREEVDLSNSSATPGGIQTKDSYQIADGVVRGVVMAADPNFDFDAPVVFSDNAIQIQRSTFRSGAIDNFKKLENESGMSFQDRLEKSISMTADGMKEVDSPAKLHVFAQDAATAIADYRVSSKNSNMAAIESLNATNLTSAYDGLMKMSYDVASLPPSTMVNKMSSSIGMKDVVTISRAASMANEGELMFTRLGAEVQKRNPGIFKAGMSEDARKGMISKLFLDTLSASVGEGDAPDHQKIAMIKQIDTIDKQIDNGQTTPEVQRLLDHVYARTAEGYSVEAGERATNIQRAEQAGRGYIEDGTSILETSYDFRKGAEAAQTPIGKSSASYYMNAVEGVPNGADFEIVKKIVSTSDGVLNFNDSNKEMFFGVPPSSAKINPGLVATLDHFRSGAPTANLGITGDAAIKNIDSIKRNISKLDGYSVMKDGKIVKGSGSAMMEGLYQKAGPKNPIDMAGLELEKHKGDDGNEYYVPFEAVDGLQRGEDPNVVNMKKVALESGDPMVIGAVASQMYLQRAQYVSDGYSAQLVNTAKSVYGDISRSPDGKVSSLTRVAAKAELEMTDEYVPFLSSPNESFTFDDKMRNDLEVATLNIEDRLGVLKAMHNSYSSQLTPGISSAISGTYTEQLSKEYGQTMNVLKEMRDIFNTMSHNSVQRTRSTPTAGMGRSGDIATEKAREAHEKNRVRVLRKQFDRYNELKSKLHTIAK